MPFEIGHDIKLKFSVKIGMIKVKQNKTSKFIESPRTSK